VIVASQKSASRGSLDPRKIKDRCVGRQGDTIVDFHHHRLTLGQLDCSQESKGFDYELDG
jgi:hypothetical protein